MAKSKRIKAPTQMELIEPVFTAIVDLGGSASNDEIRDKVIENMKLSDEIVDEPHQGESSQRTELEYQLAWARTRLKAFGAITNSKRGIWIITPEFSDKKIVTRNDVVKFIKEQRLKNKPKDVAEQLAEDNDPTNDNIETPEELEPWRNELAEILKTMDPFAFERLSMLLLRECGFTQVSVTKKTGDGGIDGSGKLRINGIFSFKVAFQCKRYSNSVSAGDIRDFRGSLTADAEKGVFITTGTFTSGARKEAADPAKTPSIDLMDGDEFIDKLIECRLGVKEKTIFEVERSFFEKV